MNEDLADIQFSPIRNYDFSHWFESVDYNGKTLSEQERKEFVAKVNEIISQYASGLPLIQTILTDGRNQHDEYHNAEYIVSSVILFVVMTTIDCMVSGKYFILADTDYDRRFMRGKMMVILNEGFKRLYGFDSKTQKQSEWSRLEPLMSRFPRVIQSQYAELSQRLENHSKSSSWWRDERNLETHLDAEKLYLSRQKEVIESKVMIDNLKLYNTLFVVNAFLTNVHACLKNVLVEKYKRGELAPE